ncbi:MAG TPA: NIL domain-containing protein [Bacteroidales bacterium]|nr:NIL domain-containing protein [Bacteroidales bacterium]
MKKRLVLTFPANMVDVPLTYNLIKDHDVVINILNADITPGREGKLLLEIRAPKENVDSAVRYIESLNITCNPVKKSILLNEEACVHCGSCSAVCFADALTMDRKSRQLLFRPEKCIACELCLKACPLQLFELNFN